MTLVLTAAARTYLKKATADESAIVRNIVAGLFMDWFLNVSAGGKPKYPLASIHKASGKSLKKLPLPSGIILADADVDDVEDIFKGYVVFERFLEKQELKNPTSLKRKSQANGSSERKKGAR